jgi:hypothetical protein
MVRFLKENGFPMTLILDTDFEYEDKENEFKGHYTIITDDKGNIVGQFAHTDLRARIHWVNGFFTALRMQNKEPETKYIVYEYTEHASEQYQGTRFMTVYDGTITGNADPEKLPESRRLKVVAKDITEEEAYKLINEVADKNADAYLNDIPKELRSPEADDFIRRLLNGDKGDV